MKTWPAIGITIGLLLLFLSQENVSLASPCTSDASCRSGTPLTFPLLWTGALFLLYSVFLLTLSFRKGTITPVQDHQSAAAKSLLAETCPGEE